MAELEATIDLFLWIFAAASDKNYVFFFIPLVWSGFWALEFTSTEAFDLTSTEQ